MDNKKKGEYVDNLLRICTMSKENKARFPNTNEKLSFKNAPVTSVGFPAIMGSIHQMKKYMDMPDALKASLKMNQKSGFDCI